MDDSPELRRVLAHLQSAHRLAGIGSWEAEVGSATRLYWSPEVHEIARRPVDDPPSYEDFVAMVHPDDRPLFLEARAAALSGERPYDIDLRVILPGGEQRRIHIVAEVLRDGHGEPVRLVGAVQDRTEEIEGLRRLRVTEVARRDLLQRLLDMADIERNRLAKHLASGPIDQLVDIEQRLAADMPDGASQLWVDARTSVRKAIESLHQTLTDIQAEVPSGDVTQIIEDLAAEAAPDVDVTTEVALDLPLRAPVQATLLRIVQEALHNVRKHAHAGQAHVHCSLEDRFVHVTVTDDGRGFDVDGVHDQPGHLGIVAMRDRLEALGGTLDIRSRPGRTVLTARLPVS